LDYADSKAALIDCSSTFDGEIIPHRYGLYLSDVKETAFPHRKVGGMQGIFYIPASFVFEQQSVI
jgi:hypothetical protein